MADGKPSLHVQAHAASLALNERSGQNANHTHSRSAPPTPHLQPKSSPRSAPAPASAPSPAQAPAPAPPSTPILTPAPQLSPVQGRTGRRLHTKVLEELKNVTSRNKSPAINPITAASGGHVPLPSPLSLNGGGENIHSQADTAQSSSTGVDGSSPRIPVPQNGSNGNNGTATTKAKMCGLCERSFTVFRAKHTCKVCSMKVCDDCSKTRAKLNRRMERRKGSRICDSCARDYMQLATPVLTGAMEPRPLDGRRSSVDSDVAGFELGGRPPTEGNLANGESTATTKHPATERFQRAASMVKQSIMASSRERAFVLSSSTASAASSSSSSFLRTRHWISLLCVAYLLAVRWLRFHTISTHGGFVVQHDPRKGNGGSGEDLPDRELLVEAHGVALLFISVTHWIDRVVSLRVLVSVVLGLVAYDELMAHTDRDRHTRHHVPAQIGRLHPQQTRFHGAVATSSSSCFAFTTLPVVPPMAVGRERTKDEDEVLEVEVGDKPVDDGEGFSYEKLVSSLVDCTTTTRAVGDNTMKMSSFLVACDFLCSFTTVFGRATSFAASTVSGYLTTISTNLAAWPVPANATAATGTGTTPFSWKEESVRAVVLREVEVKIASSGGKKKPSCSRCVLRLVWFVEFVEACVRYTLIENTDESCAAGASKAYEETIGSRHPWIVRKGVNSALGSLPMRSAILESLHLHELSPEETIAHLQQGQMAMRAMLTELTALLKEHNLLDIK